MKRRFAIKFCIFLLLGAVVNVAVAWGFAARTPTRTWSHTIRGAFNQNDQIWRVLELRKCGVTQVWWGADIRYDMRGNVPSLSIEERLALAHRQVEIDSNADPNQVRNAAPDFGSFHEPIPNGVLNGTDWAYGWPWRSLWCRVSGYSGFGIDASPRFEGGLLLEELLRPLELRALPAWPIWPGFAINTLFYATILWLLFALPFTLRRWRRVRRGLCAKCAYPVGASDVCTECGTAIHTGRRSVCS